MAHDDPLIGTVLDGRYEIVRPLGRGGMGAVYEAINTRLGKRVALKTLRADLAPSDDNYRRFQQEAEVAASLGHPHICESHDFRAAKDGEPAFIVMDYLEGEDLEQRIARAGPLPLARVVVLVDEIAGALHAAHERGVVHRDLKPQNIFLCRYGERDDYPKVLDFGVSKVRHEPSVETAQSEAYLGSPHYMAPEQAEGYSARADARTDIFALGGIIFRMLSGEHAYSAPNLPAILHQIVYGEPRVLSEVAPDVPLAVSEVVARALSKKPAARFGSVKSLASALALAAEQSARRRATSEQGVRQAQSEVETAPTVKAETPRSLSIAPEAREATRPRGGRGGLLLAAAVVGLVALGGFVALRWGSGGPPASARATAAGPDASVRAAPRGTASGAAADAGAPTPSRALAGAARTMLVLPFHNTSSSASFEWLRGAMADTLQAKLGRLRSLVLLDASRAVRDARALIGRDASALSGAAKRAGAALVVVGGFQIVGPQLRLTARVLRTRDGIVRASATATGKTKALFAVQDALVQKLVEALGLDAEARAAKVIGEAPVMTMKMAKLLGSARNALFGLGGTAPSADKAAQMYREVIAKDPRIAQAYVGLARTMWRARFNSKRSPAYLEIERLLRTAMKLRPDYHEAIAWLGNLLWKVGERDAATDMYRRALSLKPRSGIANYMLGVRYAAMGQVDQALPLVRLAIRIEPYESERRAFLGMLLAVYKRQYARALRHTRAAIKLKTAGPWTYLIHGYVELMLDHPKACLAAAARAEQLTRAEHQGTSGRARRGAHDDLQFLIVAACRYRGGQRPRDLARVRALLTRAKSPAVQRKNPQSFLRLLADLSAVLTPALDAKR